jgi:GAF domain-containing protein
VPLPRISDNCAVKSTPTDARPAALDPQTLELRYRLLREVGELALADLPDEALLRGVTDLIIAASGADGGFLLRLGPNGRGQDADEFEVVLARNYQQGDILKPEFEISRTLVRRVIREQAPVFVEDAGLLSPASLSGSIRKLGVISVIALPLRQASPE